MKDHNNPCQTCGACCASFRVSFYWAEADQKHAGAVPDEYIEKLNAFRAVMRGTNQAHPHCAALIGEVGKTVRCAIYDRRPSTCRNLKISWSLGVQEEGCDKARAVCGLAPLSRAWNIPDHK